MFGVRVSAREILKRLTLNFLSGQNQKLEINLETLDCVHCIQKPNQCIVVDLEHRERVISDDSVFFKFATCCNMKSRGTLIFDKLADRESRARSISNFVKRCKPTVERERRATFSEICQVGEERPSLRLTFSCPPTSDFFE
jgi:hypothetical protein